MQSITIPGYPGYLNAVFDGISGKSYNRIMNRPREEKNKIFSIAHFFPKMKPGHGGTHQYCNAKGCGGGCSQSRAEAAEQYLAESKVISAISEK